jgi:hypothetical protein
MMTRHDWLFPLRGLSEPTYLDLTSSPLSLLLSFSLSGSIIAFILHGIGICLYLSPSYLDPNAPRSIILPRGFS